jgi:hypothetical protein
MAWQAEVSSTAQLWACVPIREHTVPFTYYAKRIKLCNCHRKKELTEQIQYSVFKMIVFKLKHFLVDSTRWYVNPTRARRHTHKLSYNNLCKKKFRTK